MPCYECENGKWKFGETGRCQYSTKSECETANKDYYAEETYDDYPQAASTNAKRAIKYKEENGSSCGTIVGWTRAMIFYMYLVYRHLIQFRLLSLLIHLFVLLCHASEKCNHLQNIANYLLTILNLQIL